MSCQNHSSKVVLASFESDNELDGLIWECNRWFEISSIHSTNGKFSLKTELSASDKPIFRIILSNSNWSKYDLFGFDVFNPEDRVALLSLRFIDKDSDEDYGQFYTKNIEVLSGMNKINIPVSEIKQGPQKRDLKLGKMKKVAFLLVGSEKSILFFDNITLSRFKAF